MSQAVRVLEARVGEPLFTRTTRSVGLTEAGERFLSCATRLRGDRRGDRGRARSGTAADRAAAPLPSPRAVVPLILEPVIASFCQAYPEVELEIAASDEMVDLGPTGGFDAGIRFGHLIAPDMVAVRLTPQFSFVVVGSPDYLRPRHGGPQRLEDLRRHACLRLRRSNGAIAPWSFADAGKTIEAVVSGPLIAHDYPTLIGAAVEGVGLAQVPEPIAAGAVAAGKLVRVLEPFAPMAPGVFRSIRARHQMMPKLRAFIDHVKSRSDNRTRIHIDDKRPRGMKMGGRGKGSGID